MIDKNVILMLLQKFKASWFHRVYHYNVVNFMWYIVVVVVIECVYIERSFIEDGLGVKGVK
jgi:hypothetical protein